MSAENKYMKYTNAGEIWQKEKIMKIKKGGGSPHKLKKRSTTIQFDEEPPKRRKRAVDRQQSCYYNVPNELHSSSSPSNSKINSAINISQNISNNPSKISVRRELVDSNEKIIQKLREKLYEIKESNTQEINNKLLKQAMIKAIDDINYKKV